MLSIKLLIVPLVTLAMSQNLKPLAMRDYPNSSVTPRQSACLAGLTSFTPSMAVRLSVSTSTPSLSVPPTFSGPSGTTPPSIPSTTSELVPSPSSIAMTILTSNSGSESGIDYFYTIPVRVGSHVLNLQLHTVAPNTIVYTVQPNVTLANITLYVPSQTQTSENIPWVWQGQNVEVDGFAVNGNLVYRDNVTVYDGPVSVGQALAIVNSLGDYELPLGIEADRPWDGVLSLTRQNASLLFLNDGKNTRVPHASWFDNILPQLRDPVIGISLRHQATGLIDIGLTNDDMHTDDIQWASSNSLVTGSWSVHVTSYRIETQPAVTCDFDMQINTGTKYTTLDTNIVNNFRTEVALRMDTETLGESAYYECNITLPNVTLTVDRAGGGSFDLEIPGKAFKLGENDDGTCEFGLVSMGGFDPDNFHGVAALGITALRTLYVVLNASELSIGFAPQADLPDHF